MKDLGVLACGCGHDLQGSNHRHEQQVLKTFFVELGDMHKRGLKLGDVTTEGGGGGGGGASASASSSSGSKG